MPARMFRLCFRATIHRNLHEAAKEQRHISFDLLQQVEQVAMSSISSPSAQRRQSELVRQHRRHASLKGFAENSQAPFQRAMVRNQRGERPGQPYQVP